MYSGTVLIVPFYYCSQLFSAVFSDKLVSFEELLELFKFRQELSITSPPFYSKSGRLISGWTIVSILIVSVIFLYFVSGMVKT